jgi:hypothetical protein
VLTSILIGYPGERGISMAAKSTFWSIRVDSIDDSRKMIRESTIGFYAIAGIQAVVSLLLGMSMLLDAVLFAGLAFWLQRRQSRVAATLLLGLAALSIATTAMNQFGGGQGGRNIILSVIVFWVAVRAVVATYKWPRVLAQQPPSAIAG